MTPEHLAESLPLYQSLEDGEQKQFVVALCADMLRTWTVLSALEPNQFYMQVTNMGRGEPHISFDLDEEEQ